MNKSKPVKVQILKTSSTTLSKAEGQEFFCVFELSARGVPQRFFLSRDEVNPCYKSGDIVGVLASAFNSSVLEIGTCGSSFHHIKVLDEDANLGFTPKTKALTIGSR